MLFNSITFICIFLPVTILIDIILPQKLRNMNLVLVSLLFFAWAQPRYIWILFFVIFITYVCGILISVNKKFRKIILVTGIVLMMGILFVFKYLGFLEETVRYISGQDIMVHRIALPIGISFFTFQGASYIVDVYRNRFHARKNPLDIALYISLFPQLVAGPIVKYEDIEDRLISYSKSLNNYYLGYRRFIIG